MKSEKLNHAAFQFNGENLDVKDFSQGDFTKVKLNLLRSRVACFNFSFDLGGGLWLGHTLEVIAWENTLRSCHLGKRHWESTQHQNLNRFVLLRLVIMNLPGSIWLDTWRRGILKAWLTSSTVSLFFVSVVFIFFN